jgi:hypothetical protein
MIARRALHGREYGSNPLAYGILLNKLMILSTTAFWLTFDLNTGVGQTCPSFPFCVYLKVRLKASGEGFIHESVLG